LGSSTYLTDNFGRPSHYYETLPFGEMMVEHNQSKYYKVPYPTTNTGSYDNKWKFNGKELDDATGMYYYGARYYDPRLSIFISVDQMVENTMTPYQYVSNNPIMRIDPTGMNDHDYKLNKDGSFTLLNKTEDKFDRIFSENKDDTPLVVEKSFMKSFSNPKYEGTYEAKISPKTMKTYGKALFNFFARNTNKEWDYNEFVNSKTGEIFGNIITSFQEKRVSGASYYIEDILDSNQDINWTYTVHNHPGKKSVKSFHPSGWRYNAKNSIYMKTYHESDGKPNGDRGFYQSFKLNSKYNKRMPAFHHVYSPDLNKTIKYNDESFNFIN